MSEYSSFADLIEDWPRGAAGLAADLNQHGGTVRAWKRNDSIPAEHWERIVQLAVQRRRAVSLELLASLAARKREAAA